MQSFSATPDATPPAPATGPLRGMRVIDFTHFVAGPYATLLLADLGAEVIKIENPARGDEFRHYPPALEALDGEGAPFLWVNRNKRSMAVDMKTPEGQALLLDLVKGADILVENFSTGVMERFGLGYETLSKLHPSLIYCSVSAYGRTGAFADRVGFDPIVQAESGFMSLNGYPDREGTRTGPSVMDIGTSMMAANGILAAVVERLRSGRGQRVETSLYASAMTMVGYAPLQTLSDERWVSGRHGNGSPDTAPTGVFHASDGPIYIACTGTDIYQRLFNLIGREDLANDPELVVKAGRLKHRDRLFEAVNAAFATDTRDSWLKRLRAARVPAGAVRTIAEALKAPETEALDIVSHIPHPSAGRIANIRSAITLEKSPLAPPVAAPALGADTRDVLEGTLGYDEERIRALDAAGVFGRRLRPAQAQETPEQAALRCPFLNP
jgi:crotonobetainyl-CoA:carnitine CoA-transferase CaiB-like acyl-CoA transferase